ncbi:hypothetical protein BC938DRAFT_478469 [Jimgerdemannia flammicorona]|uniref:Uncharacterized protein n=1 Tax=Jimgerdemannia flammicorona TaxID=994334 RepID=A0A433QMU4_9FUNG|nr:hypothetical protein BC938DRAFT_478469 [Jimgerdemannia flammicorona]
MTTIQPSAETHLATLISLPPLRDSDDLDDGTRLRLAPSAPASPPLLRKRVAVFAQRAKGGEARVRGDIRSTAGYMVQHGEMGVLLVIRLVES